MWFLGFFEAFAHVFSPPVKHGLWTPTHKLSSLRLIMIHPVWVSFLPPYAFSITSSASIRIIPASPGWDDGQRLLQPNQFAHHVSRWVWLADTDAYHLVQTITRSFSPSHWVRANFNGHIIDKVYLREFRTDSQTAVGLRYGFIAPPLRRVDPSSWIIAASVPRSELAQTSCITSRRETLAWEWCSKPSHCG